jgi:transcription elongation factor GreA|uniref:Transcription elongation factor GreA n=1 Tax=Desulfobacca acetoxidans TaxID=60893 RepID=A0A7C5ALT8_9BACT
MGKILLTRAGYEEILRELRFLSLDERPRLLREMMEAAPEWEGAADPEFQRLLARRRRLERRIEYLQQLLSNAEVLVGSNHPPDRVRFNCRVRIRNLATGKEQQFRLVGPVEADAQNGRLSITSPLGRALMGRALGERVDLETPAGLRSYQILSIFMDDP